MQVLLTGGTGFIGQRVVQALIERGDVCTVISRSGRDPWNNPSVRVVTADPVSPGQWQSEVETANAIINLAGETIFDPK